MKYVLSGRSSVFTQNRSVIPSWHLQRWRKPSFLIVCFQVKVHLHWAKANTKVKGTTMEPFQMSAFQSHLPAVLWFLVIFLTMSTISLFTVRKQSCRKVMFSQACVKNSVYGRRCTLPLGRQAGTPSGRQPQAHTPLGGHPRWQTCRHRPRQTHLGQTPRPPAKPPQEDTLGRHSPPRLHHTATAADGTHPTGMHSCSN